MKNLFLNHNKRKGILETFVAWFMAFSLVIQGLAGLPLVAFAGNEAPGTNSSSAENTSQSGNAVLNQKSANTNEVTSSQTSIQTSNNEKIENNKPVDNSSGLSSLKNEDKSQGQETPENLSGNLVILQTLAMSLNSDVNEDDDDLGDVEEKGDKHHKVTICHIPKGNPGNAHVINVDEHSVKYNAHLKHGDKVGPCEPVPPEVVSINIVSSKIVCDAESKLPNWGMGGLGIKITSTTASDYVSSHPGCALTPDWKFQWGYQGVGDAGATLVGEAPNTGTSSTDWKTFGPTNAQGQTSVSVNNVDNSSVIWVREVLKEGYVPFTFDSNHQQNDNNVSAEMYCHTDVLNYDNYDQINVPLSGHTYYCVAFNALKKTPPPPTSCTVDVVSDTNDKIVGGANATATYSSNPRWTAIIPGATWIWKTFFVSDPTHDETTYFAKDFVINGTVASATMTLAADNSFKASVNSTVVGIDNTELNYFEENKHVYNVASSLHSGTNTVAFEVKNWAQSGGNAQTNPAGLLYKLHVVYLSQNSNCTTPTPPANTPPVITLVGDNPLIVTQGSVFTDPGATSTDKEDGNLTSMIIATGTVNTSVLGTTTRTYTVTDSGGLSASTTRTVIVKDIYLPPMNSCEGVYGKVISSVDGWGFHTDNIPEHYTVFSGDNQPTHGDTLDNSWVHAEGQGHSITWSLSLDTKTIRVFTSNDHGPYPAEFEEYNVLVSHDNITWSAPLTGAATYVGDINNVKVHDGVKDFVSTSSFRYVRLVQNGISGADFEIDAIKSCGRVTNEAPVITLIGENPLTVSLNSVFVEPGANATDTEDCVGKTQAQCNSALHLTATGTVNTSAVGSYSITYTAYDSAGLQATPKTRIVKVVTQCSDGIDNDGDGLIDSLDLGCDSSTDNNENSAPIITVITPNPTIVTVGGTFTDLGANATDTEDCMGKTQAQCNTALHLTATGTVNTGIVGTYTITYNATDSKNLAATPKTRTVNVVSAPGCTVNCGGVTNTPPVITLIGANPLVVHINSTFVNPGANATDTEDCVGKTQAQCNTLLHLTATGTVDTTNVGNYVITYNATDSKNLSATPVTRTVKVVSACSDGVDNDGDGKIDFPNDAGCTTPNDDSENQKPVITLIGDVVMQLVVGTPFTDGSATVADPEEGNITNKLVATGTVNQNTVGTYTITYNATDSQNLAATPVTRTVNVVSGGCTSNCGGGGGSGNARPVITVLGANPLSVTQNTAFTDPGATAFDSEDGNITPKIVATGTVNTAVVGTYTITYDVSDSQNLPAQQKSRVVNVVVAGNPGCTSNCGGGGGGGGGGSPSLSITNEKLTVTGTTTVTVTWDTNLAADSRVVYGLNSVSTLVNPPYYGYQITTATDTTLTIKHTMVIIGIPSAIATYFRPVSSVSSLTATGIELKRQPDAIVGGSCEYLKEHMRLGINNNPTEVTKLQLFLKNFEGYSDLAVTGFFDITTDRAVRGFQDKYKSDVLDPWNLPGNTGYVYYTTKKKVNEIYCQRAFPLNGAQLTEIASFRELIARINAQSTAAPTLPLVGINRGEGSTQGNIAGASIVRDSKPFEGVTISDVPGTQTATETDNRGHIALSDLLAIPSSMSNELGENNGTATDAGVVAGASTRKQGIAAVIDSLELSTHPTPLQVILVLLLILLAIGSALFFGLTKGPEVKSVHMNIDNNN